MNKNYGKLTKKLLCWGCVFSLCVSSTAMAATGANIGDVYFVADGSIGLRVCGSDSVSVCSYDESKDSNKELYLSPKCTLVDKEGNIHVDEEGNQIDFRITEIEKWAFAPNKVFNNINIEAGTGLKIGTSAFENVVVQGNVSISDGELAELGDSAFAKSDIEGDLTIKNMNGSIGTGAFQDMKVIGRFDIFGRIDTLGDHAFAGMDFLKGFSMPSEICHMGNGVYKDVYLSRDFIMPLSNSLKSIGSRVFEGAVLEGVKLPEGDTVEYAAADAFEEGMLIVIPKELTNLEVFHFDQYKNLTFQTAADLSDDSPVIQYLKEKGLTYRKGEYGELIYPEPVEKPTETPASSEKTNKNSTYSVGALKYRLLGKNKAVVTGPVKKSSTSISIPGTVTINGKLYQVTKVGKKAFKGMKKLKKVKVGNYVKNIQSEAFAKCPKLQNIQFGTGLVSIGKKVLYQDKGLCEIFFKGTKLKKIGKKTFSGVSPEKVTIKVKKSKLKYYQKLIQKAK